MTSVRFTTDGKYIISGAEDGFMKVWDTETGKLYSSYRGHTGILYSYTISYLDSGRKIIYAMTEGQVKVVGF